MKKKNEKQKKTEIGKYQNEKIFFTSQLSRIGNAGY